MSHESYEVNTVAPLTNVGICMEVVQRALQRPPHLPGIVCFSGPSGFGKSTAAGYVANRLKAYYIECKSTWTRKAVLMAILREMGIPAAKTIYEMTDQISEQLALSGRPLIIDEMDHLVEKKAVEIVRDIHEGAGGAAILLLGEEQLPNKLKCWERFDGRILDWKQAEPVSLTDIAHLCRLYCPDVAIGEDLLVRMHELANGSARRVCVNLDLVREEARREGWDEVDLNRWGSRRLFTGRAPGRRA